MASEGHILAIAHWLQLTQMSWIICRCKDPFPKEEHPSTHLPQPMHRSSSMVYSKNGSSTKFLFIAAVGHNWFSPPVCRSITPGLKYPPQRSQKPHNSYAWTHFTADGVNTHSSAQRPHCVHLNGSICQTNSPVFDLPKTRPPNPPMPTAMAIRAELCIKSLRLSVLFSSFSFILNWFRRCYFIT